MHVTYISLRQCKHIGAPPVPVERCLVSLERGAVDHSSALAELRILENAPERRLPRLTWLDSKKYIIVCPVRFNFCDKSREIDIGKLWTENDTKLRESTGRYMYAHFFRL